MAEERGMQLSNRTIIYTDPNNPDTDGDGLVDGREVYLKKYGEIVSQGNSSKNLYYYEYYIVSDPNVIDSDNDGLNDCEEIEVYMTNALNIDTDSDQISDYDEVYLHKTDPKTYDKYLWPIPGVKNNSNYGWRDLYGTGETKFHGGYDIHSPNGTSIYAVAPGIVIKSEYEISNDGSYGMGVIIDHGNSITTLYAHCSSVEVKDGDIVKRGQIIGYVGSTGDSTGNHLHIEFRESDKRVDPGNYITAP